MVDEGVLVFDDCKDIAELEHSCKLVLASAGAVAVANKPRWIPVTERLPEYERNVLVTVYFHGVRDYKYGENAHLTPSYYVEVAQRYDDEWHSDSDEYKIAKNRHEVIAWMPLPEPYGAKRRTDE